jgi:flagellar hook assembly protein FlgD
VKIVIYDEIGREVKALFAGDQEAGYQSMTWNSTNSAGNSVASGMYFYRIEAGSSTEKRKTFVGVKKMLLIR